MPVPQALELAADKGLDVVEVSPNSDPPVCRLMDYGRYKFQHEKKFAESRKHQAVVQVKEIKLRPRTGKHDFDFKMRHVRRFLESGDRVKVTIRFRGREIVHSDQGYALLERIAGEMEDIAVIENQARMEGRQLFLLLVPKKGSGAG